MPTEPKIISADSHVLEPAALWEERIDPKYRAVAPRLAREERGDFWLVEGIPPSPAGLQTGAGKRPDQLSRNGRYSEAPPGAADPEARLAEIAQDGIAGEVIYPTIALRFYRLEDLAYQDACLRVYNTWIAEFCRAHPEKYRGLGCATTQDLDYGLAQLRQVADLGLAGAVIAISPDQERPYYDPYYEPFWAAVSELRLPLSLHVHTGRTGPLRTDGAAKMVEYPLLTGIVQRTLSEMIFGQVFERHPNLRVVSAENDASWAANFQQRMDYNYRRKRYADNFFFASDALPSDFFKRHVFLTFMNDRAALVAREIIGVGNLMWSSDYPHTDSTFPHSRQVIAENCAGVPESDVRKIVCENAAALYQF
jgi:predicted TIM-barrel fold metal-dependent hydrolase